MINLVLFVATTIAYWLGFGTLLVLDNYRNNPGTKYLTEFHLVFLEKSSRMDALKMLGIIALLCLPLNINGNVFTVMGNVHSTGVKNIYSVFSVYQNAEYNVYSLLGALYQKADNGNAVALIGLLPNQIAGDSAGIFIGVTPYQKAKVVTTIGIGISLYQSAGHRASVFFGLNGWQYGNYSIVFGGGSIFQKSKEESSVRLGIVLDQNSEKLSSSGLAMSVYQRAGDQSRAFAVWSKLQAE